MTTPEDTPKEGELLEKPATLDARRDRCSLDDAYIFNYTQNPKAGKTAALRAAGYEGNPDYIRQEAHRMHNRLRLKIQAVTAENMRDLGSLSVQQVANILQMDVKDTGIANMLAAAKLGRDFSKTEPKPVEDMPKTANPDERRRRIAQIQKELAQKTGQKELPSPA